MALTQGLLNSYWQRYNQRRALTGLPASYQEQRGFLDPAMEATANKDIQEAQLRYNHDIQNRQLSIQEEAAKNANRAATISGIAQTGGLLSAAYLTNRALTNQASSNNIIRQYLLGNGGTTTTPEIPSSGMFSGPNPWSAGAGSGGAVAPAGAGSGALTAPGALQAPGYTAPVLQTPTTFAGAEAGAAVPGAGSALLANAPLIGAAYGANMLAGKFAQPYLDKAGLPTAGKWGTYAGLPGAFAGASLDVGEKVVNEVHDFISKIF